MLSNTITARNPSTSFKKEISLKGNRRAAPQRLNRHIKSSKSSVFINFPSLDDAVNQITSNSSYKEQKPVDKVEIDKEKLVFEKENELLELRQKLNEKDLELKRIKRAHMLTPMNVSSLNLQEINTESPIIDISNIYNSLVMKLQSSLKTFESRMKSLLDLTALLENCNKNGLHSKDLLKIHEFLKDLSETLTLVSRNEIELNHLHRELDKKTLENMKSRLSLDKMKARSDTLQGKLQDMEKKQQLLIEENGLMMRSLQQETTKQIQSHKKVGTLRTRLEAIVQNSHNKYIVNTSLKELMKENDGFKWKISAKNGEIEKLTEVNQQLKGKILQLSKKLDNLNQRKLASKKESEAFLSKKNPFLLLNSGSQLPMSLDFKQQSLKVEYSNMLNDITLYGANAFSAQISSLDNVYQRKTAIEFITSQFIGYKNFAENLNGGLIEILGLMQCQTLQELMLAVSKNLKNLLKSEEIYLWLEDEMTGILYSLDSQSIERRAFKETGLFQEAFEKKQTLFSFQKEVILYEIPGEGKHKTSENVILLPLIGAKGNCFGLLEISKLQEFEMDDEYSCILVILFGKLLVKQLKQLKLLKKELKFQGLFHEFLLELSQTTSKFTFSKGIKEWGKKIFGISIIKFQFIMNNELIEYTSETNTQTYEANAGISGQVLLNNRPMIFTDVCKNPDFNPYLDISSILPVLYLPIGITNLEKKWRNIGLLQIVMKSKNPSTMENNEYIEALTNQFCSVVGTACKLLFIYKVLD